MAGSGAVMSTASDMAKWMNFHLYGGKNADGDQVMEEKHLKEVHKSRMIMSQNSDMNTKLPKFPVKNSEEIYAHGFKKGYYRGM